MIYEDSKSFPECSVCAKYHRGLPWWLTVKNLPGQAVDMGSIPGLEDSPEKEMVTHSRILA